jgi:hypothetical protein
MPKVVMLPESVNLVNLARGAAVERFDRALEEVLANISDVNCPAEKAREVNLKVKFVPNEERDQVGILLEVSTKLASLSGVTTTLHVGRIDGKVTAIESNPKQQFLFDPAGQPAGEGAVVKVNPVTGEEV